VRLLRRVCTRTPIDAPGFARIAFPALVSGFVLVAVFPAFQSHFATLEADCGFAVVTFAVATRVVFGHRGNLEKLKVRNWWLLIAVGLTLFDMATRISGDFWPKIMVSQ
jgi:hypothetical protein